VSRLNIELYDIKLLAIIFLYKKKNYYYCVNHIVVRGFLVNGYIHNDVIAFGLNPIEFADGILIFRF